MMKWEQTVVDERGCIAVSHDLMKKLGLPEGGTVEWFMNDEGHVAFSSYKDEAK